MTNDKFLYLLRLGDSTLILSHRLSEWCGKGPALEEDMALANTALDLLGQARQWLSYAGEVDGMGQDEDDIAYLRNAEQYTNFLIVERPNGSYADTMVRQFFFDAWYHLALQKLVCSKDMRIAAIAEKAAKEVRYHLRRSSDLIVRLGDGTTTSRTMVQAAVDELWPFTGEMFEPDAIDRAAVEAEIGFDPSSLRSDWLSYVHSVLDEATIKMPSAEAWMQSGGKQGRHTEALGYLLAEMQSLRRAHPGADW